MAKLWRCLEFPQKLAHFVHSRSFRGKGVAKAMFEECAKLAEDKGLGAVECMALSFYTQKICHSLGYQEHFR